ncbi:hypothetical protein BDV96DRAFT_649080 [Lophiotrema nucula]|uniref:Major facilitator superfamily domain-containing protein n=1 Tax=Lophiotrema nucula TaxID=690887 RepID=A0A6A5YYP2_9PLEO|nr:hypothetical protein BDV96DRAFT_649080 [Lophiotrema nucula]
MPLRVFAEGKKAHTLAFQVQTLTLCRLQVVWSVVLSNGTAYLLTLGMPSHVTAITWMAGPLCGTFVQPYMGTLSDKFGSRYGRRRPFIMLGAIGTVLSIFFLACVEQLVSSLNIFLDDNAERLATCTAAFFLIWSLSFWIQPLQVGVRALIVDLFPKDQQPQASACASYWVGCGNLIGAASGFVSLPDTLGLVRWTQFQCLCLIATVALTSTVIVGCLACQETPAQAEVTRGRHVSAGLFQVLKRVRTTSYHLNDVMRHVMLIQFFSWMAWFPFLYYGSSYIANLFAHQEMLSNGNSAYHAVQQTATRFGTLSFFSLSCSMLLTSIILHACLAQTQRRIASIWIASQILYAMALLSTYFIATWRASLIITFYVGISFSVTQFAPFAILGQECVSMKDLDGEALKTGTVMGLHNVAISLAQLISAGVCFPIFLVFKSWGLDGSLAFVIRLGAVPALAAAWQLRKLQRTLEKQRATAI